MASFTSTRYPGVYYKELSTIDPQTKKPDRTYYVNVPDEFGNRHWMKVGRQSHGVTLKDAVRFKMDNAMALPASAKKMTFKEVIEIYVAQAEARGQHIQSTISMYNTHCKRHIDSLPVETFTPSQAESLKIRLQRTHLAPQSVHYILSFLSRVVNHAIGRGLLTKNPFRVTRGGVFQMPTVNNKRERFFSAEECKAILEALKKRSPQLWQMALVSLHTGLRASEIFRLTYNSIAPNGSCLYVDGKGNRRQAVAAPKHIIDMLLAIPKHPRSNYVFPQTDGSRKNAISKTFGEVITSLGLQAPRNSLQRITFHTFRHTFASLLAQSGKADIYEIKTLMRHKSIEMTMRYAHLLPSQTNKKILLIGEALKGSDLLGSE